MTAMLIKTGKVQIPSSLLRSDDMNNVPTEYFSAKSCTVERMLPKQGVYKIIEQVSNL